MQEVAPKKVGPYLDGVDYASQTITVAHMDNNPRSSHYTLLTTPASEDCPWRSEDDSYAVLSEAGVRALINALLDLIGEKRDAQ